MANIRFFRRGVTRVWFTNAILPAELVAPGAPTAAHIIAGTDLTPFVADMSGFTYANTPIPVPDLTDNFDAQIPGVDAAANSLLKFYELRSNTANGVGGGTGNDALRTAVAKGQSGWIVIFWGGCKNDANGAPGIIPTALDHCEVWPATSTGPSREYVMTPNAGLWAASFSINARPFVDAVVA